MLITLELEVIIDQEKEQMAWQKGNIVGRRETKKFFNILNNFFPKIFQDELEYWKARGAKLTLLVDQINTQPARMTLVTLRAAQVNIQ